MMTRTEQTFDRLKKSNKKALVGFLVAGDPDLRQSEQRCRIALENGVDILELGVPFSDPTADGPVIQAAGQRALAAGMTLSRTIELAGRLRRDYAAPLVLFGYANLLFSRGYARVAEEAAAAGVDAFLTVDLPFEESAELRTELDGKGLDFITLVAPTTPDVRLGAMLKEARGFVYYIMVKGVTGARTSVATDVEAHLNRLRRHTALPVVAGFGVSNGAQARAAAAHADGIVVGSALIQAAEANRLAPLVKELRQALDAG